MDDRDMMVAVGPDGRMDIRASEKCDFFDKDESGGRRQTESDARDKGRQQE